MKTIQLNGKKILVVDVPEDAYDFELLPSSLIRGLTDIMYRRRIDTNALHTGIPSIESGNFQILGRVNVITEEQAKGMVEFNLATGFYKAYNSEMGFIWNTPLESFHSLMRANQVEGNPLLLIEN